MIDPTIGVIGGGLLAAAATWFVAVRRLSGKIETSDAAELWKESSSIREWSERRIKDQNNTIKRLDERIKALEETNSDLITTRLTQATKIVTLTNRNIELEGRLSAAIAKLEARSDSHD